MKGEIEILITLKNCMEDELLKQRNKKDKRKLLMQIREIKQKIGRVEKEEQLTLKL